MDAASTGGARSLKQLVLVPALITLAVTLLRLIGELQSWSPRLFNPEPGGGGSLVGIVWLVPVFGIYFALKLVGDGRGPRGAGRAIGFALLGFGVAMAIGVAGARLGGSTMANIVAFNVAAVVATLVTFRGWPALGRTLVAYGFAARIPVAIVMFFAIMGDWGTHYDGPPPNFPPSSPLVEWLLTGLMPQLVFWVAFTVVFGMLFGGIAAALARKRVPATA